MLSMTTSDVHETVLTYIIGDCGNILEAGEEADLVRTGIFVGYTRLMLELPELHEGSEVHTMGTCIPPGRLNVLLDKI